MAGRLLVLPHVGTALGHLIRVGEVLQSFSRDWKEIFVVVPSYAIEHANKHLPSTVTIRSHDVRFTVTSPRGKLDLEQFGVLLANDKVLAGTIRPDFILGDPGIRAGILGQELGIPWGAVTHAPYLPFPQILARTKRAELGRKAWSVIQKALDLIVRTGSNNRFQSWDELRGTAIEEISTGPDGIFVRKGNPSKPFGTSRIGWVRGKPLACLVTVSSGDKFPLPKTVTDLLAQRYGEVGVVGPIRPSPNPLVTYLGSNFDLNTLVSRDTEVVSHGGSGTLQYLSTAKSIVVVPGDLDQLCNGLIAEARGIARLSGMETWKVRLTGDSPFVRRVPWEEYLESEYEMTC
ncbi:MAG: hypothetical protein HY322_20810 [Betaproteobacteria bacterium]|nr:hypothetical protein [Betaproteobacteria bacterium]